jgi:hypothetical protein
MGEMGRKYLEQGIERGVGPLTQPSHSPSGTATTTASEKPTPTRINDAPMCIHKVPSLISSTVPVKTCQGVGKITLWVSTTMPATRPPATPR